jgi:carbamoyltransferase
MIILGSKFYGHDSAIYQIDTEHKTLFAASTERVTRKKHDDGFVVPVIESMPAQEIEVIAHSFLTFREPVEACIRKVLKPNWLTPNTHIDFFDHHLCHAVSAYFSSPYFERSCLIVTLDGRGDGFFSKAYIFDHNGHQEIGASPAVVFQRGDKEEATSIGRLYEYFTAAAGFKPSSDEGKIEALAAFGNPVPNILQRLRNACLLNNNAVHIPVAGVKEFYDLDYLRSLIDTHGVKDIAATIQAFLEGIVVDYINALSPRVDADCLCLAGGVAANIIMNLKIYEQTRFKNIHVVPYMGDEGTACGAAILAAERYGHDVSWVSNHIMPYLGPSYSREEVNAVLWSRADKIKFTDLSETWPELAAQEIVEGHIIAVFQGKMEFGPRALGNRSILANPADPAIRERLNVSIKHRPPWQPFCPSILESDRERLFTASFSHKHMAMAFRMNPAYASALPAAIHVDGTARPQFVLPEDNPNYYRLLVEMRRLTGLGVVVNTSFNIHGRAIVMTPDHAVDDFLDCNLDALFIEGFRVTRI